VAIHLRDASSSESDFVFDLRREAQGPYIERESGWVLRVNPGALDFYLAGGCQIVAQTESHFSLQWSE
jgi:hypothetical protein